MRNSYKGDFRILYDIKTNIKSKSYNFKKIYCNGNEFIISTDYDNDETNICMVSNNSIKNICEIIGNFLDVHENLVSIKCESDLIIVDLKKYKKKDFITNYKKHKS